MSRSLYRRRPPITADPYRYAPRTPSPKTSVTASTGASVWGSSPVSRTSCINSPTRQCTLDRSKAAKIQNGFCDSTVCLAEESVA